MEEGLKLPRYLNRKAVKDYFHRYGHQIGQRELDTMDRAVEVIMQRAMRYANRFTRIKSSEIELAVKKGG